MRASLLGLGALVVAAAASVSVINAQHTPPVQHSMPHQMCGPHAGTSGDAADEHVSMLAAKLELTAEQRATLERVSNEACAAMAKYHQQILDVLTPEQQAKLNQLHDTAPGGLHEWFRKLHGGR